MAFDVNFAINSMYPVANAAYLVMNVPAPPLALPPGFSIVGTIQADPSLAAPAMATAPAEAQRIPNVMVAESSIFGLVAFDAPSKTAIVGIRGTKTVWDWIGDFDAAPLPWVVDPTIGLVHMGFALVYEHIKSSVRQLVTTQCQGVQNIWVTGHSLGGALAVLAAYDLFKTTRIVPQLYTFAGPRVGDFKFEAHFDAAIPVCNRIVNFMDVVPQVPLPPLYLHVGQETVVHGGFRPLDVTYAHHLTTYLAGLQKIPMAAPVAPVGRPPVAVSA